MSMQIRLDVLECNSGVSKAGRPYNVALVRIDGRVGKVFSDLPLKQGTEPLVEMQIAPNNEMFLTPRIKSVVAE